MNAVERSCRLPGNYSLIDDISAASWVGRSVGVMESGFAQSRASQVSGLVPSARDAGIEAPAGTGLVHVYVIHPANERRVALHKLLSQRPNMIVKTFPDRQAFLNEASELDGGCVILFGMAGDEGLSGFIRDVGSTRRFACLAMAVEIDIRAAIDVMKAGAVDCLLYPCEAEELLGSVDDALTLVRRAARENAAATEARQQIGRLTAREKDVLLGLLDGKSNKMIALDLEISPRTVEIYRAHLMEKLGTKSLSDTLKVAFAAGLV